MQFDGIVVMVVDTWPPPTSRIHLKMGLTDSEINELDDITIIILNVCGKFPTKVMYDGRPYPKEVEVLMERYLQLRVRQNMNAS